MIRARLARGCFLLGLALAATASAQTVAYDDFEAGPSLDPDRWRGHLSGAPFDHLRRIQLGQLHLWSQAYAPGELGVALPDPGAATALFADLQVEGATARDCSLAETGSEVAFSVHGVFYQNAAGEDIGARLELLRRTGDLPGADLEARCSALRCTSPGCATAVELAPPSFLGTLPVDQTENVGLSWSGATRFTCTVGESSTEVIALGQAPAGPPAAPLRALSIAHRPGCPATDPVLSQRTAMEVFVDDVTVTRDATRDLDGDGIADVSDNCPHTANPSQSDVAGIGTGSDPDGVGDACQCGDLDADGAVTSGDAGALRSFLAGLVAGVPAELCRVNTGSLQCDILQATVLRRAAPDGTTPPGIAQLCDAALPD